MLVIKSNVIENAKATSLFAYDKTGLYNATTNAGGLGTPNPATSDILTSVLRVYQPDPITLLPLSTYIEVDLFPTFPTTDKLTPFEITAASQSVGATWRDGWYLFKFRETTVSDTYEATVQRIMTSLVCCCSQQPVNNSCGCSDMNDKYSLSNLKHGMVRTINNLAGCAQYRKAICVLKDLQRICNRETDCGGCK